MLTQSMMLKTIKPTPIFQKRHYDWLASLMAATRPEVDDLAAFDQWHAMASNLMVCLEDEAKQSGTNFKRAVFWSVCNA